MDGTERGLGGLQCLLEIQISIIYISLGLERSPQIVQGYDHMGVPLAVFRFFRLQILLIVRSGQGQVLTYLVKRPKANGIPGGWIINSARGLPYRLRVEEFDSPLTK